MAINSQQSREYPHIEWIQFEDGRMHECAVLKKHPSGSWLVVPINHLDDVDRRRLASLLADRNARSVELWDLLSQRTLNNGMNALAYFHQLAKMIDSNGKVSDPMTGVIGAVSGVRPGPAAPAA